LKYEACTKRSGTWSQSHCHDEWPRRRSAFRSAEGKTRRASALSGVSGRERALAPSTG